jgi:hypothetical protein
MDPGVRLTAVILTQKNLNLVWQFCGSVLAPQEKSDRVHQGKGFSMSQELQGHGPILGHDPAKSTPPQDPDQILAQNLKVVDLLGDLSIRFCVRCAMHDPSARQSHILHDLLQGSQELERFNILFMQAAEQLGMAGAPVCASASPDADSAARDLLANNLDQVNRYLEGLHARVVKTLSLRVVKTAAAADASAIDT